MVDEIASYTGNQVPFHVGINCHLNTCVVAAKSFSQVGITLSQLLLEHRHYVIIHIRLPDKYVARHFCLQAFLSKQSFPSLSLSCSSAVILLPFISVGAASSNFTRVVNVHIVQRVMLTSQGFFCQQVLSIILIAFLSRPDISAILLQIYISGASTGIQCQSQEQRCSNIGSQLAS